jgi:aspartate aminotransferase
MNDAGVAVYQPDGGFLSVSRLSFFERKKFDQKRITTSLEFSVKNYLMRPEWQFYPGSSFGRPETELTARIAYVDFDGIRALSASEQVKTDKEIDQDFLETYCGNTLDAIDRICDWVK